MQEKEPNQTENGRLQDLAGLSDAMMHRLQEMLCDGKQFRRHIVKEQRSDENGKAVTVHKERVFRKVDTKAVLEMTHALREMTATVGALQGVMQEGEETYAVEMPPAEDGEV